MLVLAGTPSCGAEAVWRDQEQNDRFRETGQAGARVAAGALVLWYPGTPKLGGRVPWARARGKRRRQTKQTSIKSRHRMAAAPEVPACLGSKSNGKGI